MLRTALSLGKEREKRVGVPGFGGVVGWRKW